MTERFYEPGTALYLDVVLDMIRTPPSGQSINTAQEL